MFEALHALAEAGETRELIAGLAELWRLRRNAEIAQVLSLISAAHLKTLPLPADKQAWHALARRNHPADLPLLSAQLFADVARNAARIKRLRSWPPDPRVADQLHHYLQNDPVPGGTARATWRLLIDWVVELRDPRSHDALGEALERAGLDISRSRRLHHGRDALEQVPQTTPLSKEELATLDSLLDLAVPGARRPRIDDWRARERKMLDAIYESPDDDTLREVYADALDERGDAFGRHMRVQLHAAAAGKWEPLTGVPQHSGFFPLLQRFFRLEWTRGLPSRARVTRKGSFAQVAKEKSLRLLHTLAFAAQGRGLQSSMRGQDLWASPWLDRLRIVHGMREPIFREFLASPHGPALHWVELYGFADITRAFATLKTKLSPRCQVLLHQAPEEALLALLETRWPFQLIIAEDSLPPQSLENWRRLAKELGTTELLSPTVYTQRLKELQSRVAR